MSVVFWTRSCHCAICKHGYSGRGAMEKAKACYELGRTPFKFSVDDCVKFKGKTSLWVVVDQYYVNALDLERLDAKEPVHVRCYTLRNVRDGNKMQYKVRESALELWPCKQN